MQSTARLLAVASLVVLSAQSGAAQAPLPLKHAPLRTQTSITPADLMTRMYLYADDSMMGRSAGTEYNLKATAYIAAEVKRLGLIPAGDSGSYFQSVPLVQRGLTSATRLAVDGGELRLWQDYLPRDQGGPTHSIDGAQAVFAGAWGDSAMLAPDQAAGKVVIIATPRRPNPGQPSWFVPRAGASGRYRTAAAVAIVSLDSLPAQLKDFFKNPQVSMSGGATPPEQPSYFYVTQTAARQMLGRPMDSATVGLLGKTFQGSVNFVETPAPARNVVAVVQGSDPKLRSEYVAIGAHNDHVGFNASPVDHDSIRAYNDARRKLELAAPNHQVSAEQAAQIKVNVDSLHRAHPARRDSIFNGADDDGSGTTAVLELAEAFAGAKTKPKRSLIFVWHTGEELGLFGSQYFTDNPTVPRDSIVAQLNMDMVGRGRADDEPGGGPRYLQLIGTRRLSTELGDIVESVNKQRKQPFTFDYQYDASGHPEQYYCRSDHYMYARYGIPIAFFTTGNHRDYHQVTDEPEYIDYDKLAAVSQFVYDVATTVANLDHRVVVDKPKPDPHGDCVQ
ncbi:MAG TPA: M28 family peptidase [Gemmatimonadales bacterium]|nr:M28 family peptidase [Gemmatimonadales bacterium]